MHFVDLSWLHHAPENRKDTDLRNCWTLFCSILSFVWVFFSCYNPSDLCVPPKSAGKSFSSPYLWQVAYNNDIVQKCSRGSHHEEILWFKLWWQMVQLSIVISCTVHRATSLNGLIQKNIIILFILFKKIFFFYCSLASPLVVKSWPWNLWSPWNHTNL